MAAGHIFKHWGRALAVSERPVDGLRHLITDTVVPAPLHETFAFFSDAANLERLTPPWLNFRIHTPLPIVMEEGVEIDYQIVLHGMRIPWRSRIDVWEPGVRFVDRQVRGPYRWWRHEHVFHRVAEGTRVVDEVEYLPRLPWLSRRIVERDLARIFAFRKAELSRIFATSAR